MNEYIKATKELAKAIEKVATQTTENNTKLVKSFQGVEKFLRDYRFSTLKREKRISKINQENYEKRKNHE